MQNTDLTQKKRNIKQKFIVTYKNGSRNYND